MKIYIKEEQNLCWFCSRTYILKMTVSRYIIAGPLLVLPTQLLTTVLRENVNDFGLRRPFYSRQLF